MADCARLILAGGGDARDSQPLDELFAAWVGPRGRMLYLPVALRERGIPYDQCLAWVQSIFRPLGVSGIEMWTDLDKHAAEDLGTFDAVYVGGGNTFSLLARLRHSGFDECLARFARRGGAIYGGSAGAIVLGRDIMTCAHLDRNDVGLADTRGLNIVAGHAVWCHYRPEDDAPILEYARQQGCPLLAISERAGVAVRGVQLESVGFEPAYRFDENGDREVCHASSG